MPYPVGITTRAVTMGGATALESAEPLILQAIIQSSRGLIWGASGWRFPSLARTVMSTAGAEITVSLPVTDLPGWRLIDAEGSILDVSVPGSYTHTYTVTLIALTAANKIVSQRILGPFALPTGDGSPVDLDTMLPVGTVAGGAVLVPDSWSAQIEAATRVLTGEDEAVALLVSTADSATRAAVAAGPIAEAAADRTSIPYARQITAANLRPLVSIYMDDGHVDDLTVIKPITDAAGVPVTVAVIASYVDNQAAYMTAAQLRQLQSEGWQIDSHTHTHQNLGSLSDDEQIDFELRESRDHLRAMGLTVDGICYPYGLRNARVHSLASRYYRAGLSSTSGTNRVPLRSHDLLRVHIPDFSLENLKSRVDNIGVGWIIFYGHGSWPQENTDKLADLLAYIQSKSIDVVTVRDALDVYANALEVVQPAYDYGNGDRFVGDRFVVGADGRIYGEQIERLNHIVKPAKNRITGALEVSATTPITDFADGVVTTTAFGTSTGSGLPYGQGGAGTLITYRTLENTPLLGFQMYYPWQTTIVQAPTFRYWTASGWGAWKTFALKSDVDAVPFRNPQDMNAFPSSAGFVDFGWGVTIWDINSSGSTGFPATTGTVTMYRSGQGYEWSYQIFEQRVSAARFKRWMLSQTTWSAWVSA